MWDERYRKGEHTTDAPHPLIVDFASKLRPGRALDVACGVGRHAIWLAEHGWNVTGVDSSRVALGILQERAREKNVRVETTLADLEKHESVFEPEGYDLIVVCRYLQRDLFPSIRVATRAGGVVIAIIGLVENDSKMNPAYLLNPGELRREFEGWELLHDFEGKRNGPAVAEIIARRASL